MWKILENMNNIWSNIAFIADTYSDSIKTVKILNEIRISSGV